MSNLSTNRSSLDHMSQSNHQRPKFQPIRVKALLHYCESDDEDSEDKPQDSDSESDFDDPQPLPLDNSMEDIMNKSFECASNTVASSSRENEKKLEATAKSEQPNLFDNNKESNVNRTASEAAGLVHTNSNSVEVYNNKSEDSKSDNHRKWSVNFEIDTVAKCKLNVPLCPIKNEHDLKTEKSVNSELSNYENVHARENQNGTEHGSKYTVNVEIKGHCTIENENYVPMQALDDQHSSCKISNTEPESIFSAKNFENVSHTVINNYQCTNSKTETRTSTNVEEPDVESRTSSNKSLTSDTALLLNSIEQLAVGTPLKHTSSTSIRPNPCFSRRNITETPQNKLPGDASKTIGLTPATILSHWSQNIVKQTPLAKTISMKDTTQTPKNSVYVTPCMARHETPRYFNTEGKNVRRPLADAGSLMHNDVSNIRLLQGSQLPKVNEVTPNPKTELDVHKTLNSKANTVRRVLEVSENAEQSESNMNGHLKKNRHSNAMDALENKEKKIPQHRVSENRAVSNSNSSVELKNNSLQTHDKDNVASRSVPNDPHNQYASVSSHNQQETKQTADKVSNVQFSMPSQVSKPKQNKTIVVKGKEYLVLGTLGQGMSGEVLRVQNLSSHELCAIKCVNLNRMDKESAQGCLEEISMLHKLQAPCIVRMFDYEIKYPMVYVVMEMGDTDLSRLLKSMSQEKQIPLTMILYYWTEMLTAVKHIHDNGVIHSDLKPANFLLVRGRLKLIDFGIASSMNADMTSVVKNCPIGTLNYISPEALMDTGGNSDSPTHNVKYKISFKSDVWSLGCILYSLVYGHTPFHHIRSQWAKVSAITNPKPNISFPTTLPSNEGETPVPSPPILIDVMRKCLQHDPKARPTVAQLLQIQYIPTKQERILSSIHDFPANLLVQIKHKLNDDEWRQLVQILENRRYT